MEQLSSVKKSVIEKIEKLFNKYSIAYSVKYDDSVKNDEFWTIEYNGEDITEEMYDELENIAIKYNL